MKALRITGIVELVEITNDLRALQHAVDGYIETIGLRDGVALIVGTDDDEFDDVPENYMQLLRLNDELA